GSKRFYEFVDQNPFIEFHPTDFITNFENMARNKKLCSVYGALSVDLLGQATNHLGTTLYGGTGGEADFVRGSALTKGGKVIVALPSVTSDGHSRIVPFLPPGPIDLRVIDVHYVVTEWGIAYLHGKTIRERVLQMVSIAAPQFRNELLEKAKEMNYVYEDQVLPTTKDGVVVICPDIEWTYETKSKGPIYFRPVLPTDERLLQELYYNLSEKDRLHRFLSQRKMFSHKETQSRIACDYMTSMVIIGTVGEEKDLRIIAEGEFFLEESTNMAEISVTVDKNYRNQGLALHIFSKIIELSQERGISGLFGEIAGDNFAMFHILNSLPYKIIITERESTFEFAFKFSDKK
nr:acetyl-CoA hydrolase/transferase C-terminal domain-containing protein [Candidatus Sigynarchaeota archaeon]